MSGGTAEPEGKGPTRVVAGILVENGRVLLTQRAFGQSFPFLWEFPGGKVEPGESPEAALVREFREEVGITIGDITPYDGIRYRDPAGRDIAVAFFKVGTYQGTPEPLEVGAVDWVAVSDLGGVDFIPANDRIVDRVRRDSGNTRADDGTAGA
jgi:8-oxo-dGTP diphosphatase